MLKNPETIEEALHLEAGTLSEAIKAEDEIEIAIPELVINKKEDHETLLDNLGKEKYEEGAEVAEKRAVRSYLESNNLTLDKAKNIPNLIGLITENNKNQFTKEPNERITELEGEKEELQGKISEWEGKYNGLIKQNEQSANQAKIDGVILSEIPGENLLIPKEKILHLFKLDYNVEYNDKGEIHIKGKDGKIIKDSIKNPKTVKDVMADFIPQYIKPNTGGEGNGDQSGTAGEGTYDAFVKEMEDKDIKTGSIQFNTEMNKRIKAGTLKV